jgi:hypothetical protein
MTAVLGPGARCCGEPATCDVGGCDQAPSVAPAPLELSELGPLANVPGAELDTDEEDDDE